MLRFEHIAAFNGAPTSLRNQHIDINEVITESIERLQVDSVVGFVSNGEYNTIADKNQLELVVDELLTNALIHGEAPVRVSTEATSERVEFRIIDGGPGLLDGLAETVLQERDFDLRENIADGTYGFGIFAARRALESMGGELRYERENHETHLIASLPLSQSRSKPIAEEGSEAETPALQSGEEPPLAA